MVPYNLACVGTLFARSQQIGGHADICTEPHIHPPMTTFLSFGSKRSVTYSMTSLRLTYCNQTIRIHNPNTRTIHKNKKYNPYVLGNKFDSCLCNMIFFFFGFISCLVWVAAVTDRRWRWGSPRMHLLSKMIIRPNICQFWYVHPHNLKR